MTNQITKQNAPNAVAGMILGISSLVFGCFFVGLVLGVVGLVLSNNELAALYAQTKQTDCHPLLLDSSGFALHKDGGAQDTSRRGQRRSSVAMILNGAELVEVLPYDAAHPETIVVTKHGWSSIHTTGITAHKGGKGNKFFKPGKKDQVAFACAAHGADALLLVRSDGNVLCVPVADLSELKAVSSGSQYSGKKTMLCGQGHTIVGILPLTVK